MTRIYKSEAGARAVQSRYLELLETWPIANQHLRVATREGETFIVACGPEDAPPPLLLFHGSGANSAMWLRDVREWAAHFRVYAIDVIGEPGLSTPSRPPLSSEAYAYWLDDVMQALSLERVALVGVSLGGWLALDYASRRPERVACVAVLCPSGVSKTRRGFLFKALALLLLGRWGRRRLLRLVAVDASTERTQADAWLGEFSSLVFRHFRPRLEKVPLFSDAALKRLTMPMLLIVGGRDALLNSQETRRRLEACAARVSVRFLPHAGHFLRHQAMPILEFLLAAGADQTLVAASKD